VTAAISQIITTYSIMQLKARPTQPRTPAGTNN